MYKRALMLTAATVALLSGSAYADTKLPATTDASGPIDITSNQSMSSSSTPATVPAIEINSATASKNIVTIGTGASVTFSGTPAAVGIQADPGTQGEIVIDGLMDLSGSGTAKTGILIGSTNGTVGTFTGTVDATNNTITSDPTVVLLSGGSLIKVEGTGSYGVHLQTGMTMVGDLIIGGTVEALPTNANSTSTSSGTAVEMDGTTTNGSIIVNSGGVVEGFGQNARGMVVLGQVNGAVQNLGSILTSGTQTTPSSDKGNPVAGSALAISNNVTGGIYNAGPLSPSDATTPAVISTNSNTPALFITPGFLDSSAAVPITIGGYTEGTGGVTYSLFNRGTISSTPQNINGASTAVEIIGTTQTNSVTLSSGIYNTGTIGASTTSDTNASTTNPPVVTGIIVGNWATIQANGSSGYAITNSNNGAAAGASSGVGTITASYSGLMPGVATGVAISANATVPSFLNQGKITATALTTDPKITSLTAIGILDQSGTLLNLNNQGTITAQSAAAVSGVAQALDNRANIAQAINLSAATGAITLTNSGTITGDVLLGSFGDTVTTTGTVSQPSVINGNMNFGGGADTLSVGPQSTVTGDILEGPGGTLNISVAAAGTLGVTNNGLTSGGRAIPTGTVANLIVRNLDVQRGGTLGLTLSDGFNINRTGNAGPIVEATSAGHIDLEAGSILKMNFGGFVSAQELSDGSTVPAQFIVFDAATGNLTIDNPAQVRQALTDGIPFLFDGSVCAYNVAGFGADCTGTNPQGTAHSDVVLTLQPKTADKIGLTGYAATMFAPANAALANDAELGAAVVNAGTPISTKSLDATTGQQFYQQIYSNFAPDVTGSARAVAISLTDQASSIVGDRQRKLRMYARQDGDVTLWAQEFGQRLSVPNRVAAGGYNNSGFGIALGMDGGSISSGRYGGAFTFYAGDTSEKYPRDSKTNSEWYMLTGYSDWRGKGLFFDSHIDIAYGHLNSRRTMIIDDLSGTQLIKRQAEGKRSSAMAAGGFSTGFIFSSGGTVLMPQFSMDALTLREEGYTESGGGAGMDLHVQPYYANSVRAFLGADLRQDLKMGDFFLQPEVRAGYRYDLLSGQEKLKVNFAGDQTVSPTVAPGSQFTITGPDPAKGNLVFGAGLAVTTDAWSVGINYDYLRGFGGTKGTSQDAMLTLVGRI